MHFTDLSPYAYCPEEGDPPALNVGWLDLAESYNRGGTPVGFIKRLRSLLRDRHSQMRGFQVCQFCVAANAQWVQEMDSDRDVCFTCHEDGRLSSAEIRVQGREGEWYAAPRMIAHYVEEHGYCPPTEFIDAVMGIAETEQGACTQPSVAQAPSDE